MLASFLLLWAPAATGGDEPFTFPSNMGFTGLMETPTARVMKENRYRVGATQYHPYRTYFGTVGIFERLEVGGRITEVSGVPALEAGYGDFKDKAVDLKLKLLSESKYAPAVALVVLDPHGTRIFPSQALVASKQLFPFDFSIGLGNGRYGKGALSREGEEFGLELFTDPKGWWNDAKVFGGIQFAPSDRFALMAEYSPIRYDRQTNDPAQAKHFQEPVPSRFNFGMRVKPTRWSEIDVSWQRGNQVSVGASLSFDIGRPLVPIYDPPYREDPERRLRPHEERIATALAESGFRDIGVESDGMTLWVEAQNDRYLFPARAVGAILVLLAPRLPASVEFVRIRLKDNGISLAEFVTTRTGIAAYSAGEISRQTFLANSAFRGDAAEPHVAKTTHRRRFTYGAKPSVETFLNDPSGYLKYRVGLVGWLSGHPWNGGSLTAAVEGYPVNTVSTSNTPLSIPVRSDIAEYKKESVALGRLQFEQIRQIGGSAYGRVAGGLLEVEYAGFDGEIGMPLFGGRLFAGAGGSAVRKREPGDPFRLTDDDWFHTAFLNARLNLAEHDLMFDVKAGRFLAGDPGARLTVSKFINGVVLSAWYSITDTSRFHDSFNRGYHDKGISVDIPIRLFTGKDSRTVYRYALSPWTRDVAQDIDHYRTLFDMIGRHTAVHFDRDQKNLFPLQ